MSCAADDAWSVRALRGLYRVTLLTLPRAFRSRFGAELVDMVGERLLHARRDRDLRALAWTWVAEIGSVLRVAWALRTGGGTRGAAWAVGGTFALMLVIASLARQNVRGPDGNPPTPPGLDARFNARDPAGVFTMDVKHGLVVAATVDGAAIPASRIVQRGDSVRLLDPQGVPNVAVRFDPERMRIEWEAREADPMVEGA